MNADSNAVPERIRKLKALADDARAPEGERAAARRKLKAALEAAGITEDQLSSDKLIEWMTAGLDKLEHDLFLAVIYMIHPSFSGVRAVKLKGVTKGYAIRCETTAEQMADAKAAFCWYKDYLKADRAKLKRQRKEITSQIEALQKDRELKLKAESKLVSLMIGRYKIYPPEVASGSTGDSALARCHPANERLSPTEKRRQDESRKAYNEAYRQATSGEAWQKPAAEVGSGQFQLEM